MVDIATVTRCRGSADDRRRVRRLHGEFVRRDAVDAFRDAVEREYPERTGRQPHVLAVEPVAGAGLVASESAGR